MLVIVVAGCRPHKDALVSSGPLRDADKRLLAAAGHGQLDLVRAAIADGADVNCRGTNGLTPLLQTIGEESLPFEDSRRQCAAVLIEHGAEVDARDGDGQTALIYAARAGRLEMVRLLVEAGAYIVTRDRFHKTPLLYAADGHREVLIYLGSTLKIQRGAAW